MISFAAFGRGEVMPVKNKKRGKKGLKIVVFELSIRKFPFLSNYKFL